ncbi:hypothetical protein MYAM1_001767 [Malassezia yamatoensis]|uniref:RRM domain-containing protein n=1 Tax=Malassezia yamatoensis TaxID=253288 RepID=A0AAJ5YSM7_9BASI|nr:hypothetical protein MYAM1_001767 [Malassezia yamatoensis]
MSTSKAEVIPVSDTAVEAVVAEKQEESRANRSSKIHIGNIPASARLEELQSILSQAGTISELRITIRESQPGISATAMYRTPESAENAVKTLGDIQVENQNLKIDLVQRRSPKSEGRSSNRASRSSRNPGRTRGGVSSRRPRADEGEEGTTGASVPSPDFVQGVASTASTDSTTENTSRSNGKPREGRRSRAKEPRKPKESQGVPSKTLLFVSHLAYSVKDEDLMDLFKAYPASSASIVYHRQHPKRSRGFAFVEFPNEVAQQKALLENNGREFHGRTIALSEEDQDQDQEKIFGA